jgi:hypothetical protein
MSFKPTNLGDGVGKQPLLFGHAISGNERSTSRKQLQKAFGNLVIPGLENTSPALYSKNILGPFRTSINGGDVLTNRPQATNIKYGRAPNQVGGNNLSRIQNVGDGTNNSGGAMYSGNPRFVYDGSDYARYKKLAAINSNYYDRTYGGGDKHSSNQSAIRKIR